MMDAAWVAIIVGVVSSIVTAAVMAAINFAALKSWMARREEREASQGVAMSRLQLVQDEHARTIGDLGRKVAVLENEMDLRPPPLDFAR
jgi:hypothetical protein